MSINLTRKNILQNFFSLVSSSLFAQLAAFFSLIVMARALGSQAYGAYVASFALTRMTSVFFNWGLDVWLLRQAGIANYPVREAIGNSLLFKFVFGAAWMLLFLAASLWIKSASYPGDLLPLVAAATWAEGLLMGVMSGFKVILRNQRSALLYSLTWLVLLAATIYLATSNSSVLVFARVRAILLLAALLVSLAWLYREVRFTFQLRVLPDLLRKALPFMLSDGLVAVYTSADIVIISMLLGKEMAGLYAPVSTLTAAAFIVPQSIFVVALPVISTLIHGPKPALRAFVRKTWLAFSLVGGGLWLGLALFAQPIVALLLGPGYSASSEVLRILSMILFFKSGSFAMVSLLIAADRQKYRLVVQAVVAAFNVILNLLVVLRFGIYGVAWVYVISEALLLAGYLVGVRKWQKQTGLR